MTQQGRASSGSQTAAGRLNNFDLLRVAATIAVIFIHVNYQYFQHHVYEPSLTATYLVESLINIVARFSVPAFVMISGAFNLRNPKNSDPGYFYRKTSWKIILPFVTAMLLFLVYDVVRAISVSEAAVVPQLKASLEAIAKGRYYNLWFMYMLIGLYVLTPLLVKLRARLSNSGIKVASFVLIAWAVGSQYVSTQRMPYAIGVVFAFLGYYLMGDALLNKTELSHGIAWYLSVAVVMALVSLVVRYLGYTYYIEDAFTAFFSPCTVVASICVFCATKRLTIKRDFSWLAGKTYNIYLFHTITYLLLFEFFVPSLHLPELLAIPVIAAATFVVSLGLSTLYELFWNQRGAWKRGWYSLPLWSRISHLDQRP